MSFYVYILENEETGIFYKGQTKDYLKRIREHNEGSTKFTSKGKWKLVFLAEFNTRSEAMIRERKLKHANKDYLRWLINQPENVLNHDESK